MGKFIIEGGRRVKGEINVQGAKNAVLPILAATIMAEDVSVIDNCPCLRDVDKTDTVLERLGCKVSREGGRVTVDARNVTKGSISEDLMRAMRSSIVFLGAIIARLGEAEASMPGGCPIGLRPIDLHLKGLGALGIEVKEEHGYIKCKGKVKGAFVHLDFPSVGATENIMLAAVTGEGETVISNAAGEPEIVDLANFLNAMGARVKGAGGSVITITPVRKLHGAMYTVMPDRIVAATYLGAAAITGGEITLKGANPNHMGAMLSFLKEMGNDLRYDKDIISLKAPSRLKCVHTVRTMPYPGFPTDIQSPFMALCAVSEGTSVFVENIFENRYQHVDELNRMGADIKTDGPVAVVRGVENLSGATVVARELRGGAALVLAALKARGKTVIEDIEFIERGYETMEKYLGLCGARILRIN